MTAPKAVTGDRAITPPAQWRKSSYSGDTGNCIEIARIETGHIAVRDSKNPAGPMLIIDRTAWRSFLSSVRAQPATIDAG